MALRSAVVGDAEHRTASRPPKATAVELFESCPPITPGAQQVFNQAQRGAAGRAAATPRRQCDLGIAAIRRRFHPLARQGGPAGQTALSSALQSGLRFQPRIKPGGLTRPHRFTL